MDRVKITEAEFLFFLDHQIFYLIHLLCTLSEPSKDYLKTLREAWEQCKETGSIEHETFWNKTPVSYYPPIGYFQLFAGPLPTSVSLKPDFCYLFKVLRSRESDKNCYFIQVSLNHGTVSGLPQISGFHPLVLQLKVRFKGKISKLSKWKALKEHPKVSLMS